MVDNKIFFRRASKAGEVEAVTHTLAKYIMELSLTDYSLVAEPPSRLAASALALAIRILEPGMLRSFFSSEKNSC